VLLSATDVGGLVVGVDGTVDVDARDDLTISGTVSGSTITIDGDGSVVTTADGLIDAVSVLDVTALSAGTSESRFAFTTDKLRSAVSGDAYYSTDEAVTLAGVTGTLFDLATSSDVNISGLVSGSTITIDGDGSVVTTADGSVKAGDLLDLTALSIGSSEKRFAFTSDRLRSVASGDAYYSTDESVTLAGVRGQLLDIVSEFDIETLPESTIDADNVIMVARTVDVHTLGGEMVFDVVSGRFNVFWCTHGE
jgi:hypothetical protein